MFTQQKFPISVTSRQAGDSRREAAESSRRHQIDFCSSFFFFLLPTLSANLSSADYFFPSLRSPRSHTAELTFVLAFKWSNFWRAGGRRRGWGGWVSS